MDFEFVPLSHYLTSTPIPTSTLAPTVHCTRAPPGLPEPKRHVPPPHASLRRDMISESCGYPGSVYSDQSSESGYASEGSVVPSVNSDLESSVSQRSVPPFTQSHPDSSLITPLLLVQQKQGELIDSLLQQLQHQEERFLAFQQQFAEKDRQQQTLLERLSAVEEQCQAAQRESDMLRSRLSVLEHNDECNAHNEEVLDAKFDQMLTGLKQLRTETSEVLEHISSLSSQSSSPSVSQSPSQASPKVQFPTLQEEENLDLFLVGFQKLGEGLGLSDNELGLHLLAHLTGAAKETAYLSSYFSFSDLAAHLRTCFWYNAEYHRLQYRSLEVRPEEHPFAWGDRADRHLTQWEKLSNPSSSWKDRLCIEKLCESVQPDLCQDIRMQNFASIDEAVEYANQAVLAAACDPEVLLTAGVFHTEEKASPQDPSPRRRIRRRRPGQSSPAPQQQTTPKTWERGTPLPKRPSILCFGCKGLGHMHRQCPNTSAKTKRKSASQPASPGKK